MPEDIIEIVHHISYRIDDAGIETTTNLLKSQINVLQTLGNQLGSLQRQLTEAAKEDRQQRSQILSEIQRLTVQLNRTSNETASTFSKWMSVVSKVAPGIIEKFQSLKGAIPQKALTGLVNQFGDVITKAGPAASAVSLLGKSVFSAGNIITIVTTLLEVFGDQLFAVDEQTRKSNEAAQDYAATLDQIEESSRKSAFEEIARVKVLEATATNTSLAMEKRRAAVDELQRLYPAYLQNIRDEAILNGHAKMQIQGVTNAIWQRARADAASKKFAETANMDYKLEQDERKAQAEYNKALSAANNATANQKRQSQNLVQPRFDFGVNNANNLVREEQEKLKALQDIQNRRKKLQAKGQQYLDDAQSFQPVVPTEPPPPPPPQSGGTSTASGSSNSRIRYSRPRITNEEETVKVHIQLDPPDPAELQEELNKANVHLQERAFEEELRGPKRLSEPEASQLNEQLKAQQLANAIKKNIEEERLEAEQKKKDEKDKRRKDIADRVEGYNTLVQAAGQAFNQIADMEIKAMDRKIAAQEKRVEAATKLVERGNTEALKLEEDRLRKLQQQREQWARRQQAVNAAMTLSSSITAVARAAAEGGGFGSIATIAALLGALAAGYATVKSLTTDNGPEAFKDGVVGYRGKGGPRDDANWVRISAGESIINAEATARNRALLEAVNGGAQLRMMGAYPVSFGFVNNKNTANDTKTLARKMDGVIAAIDGLTFNAENRIDGNGVHQIVETTARRQRNRWS